MKLWRILMKNNLPTLLLVLCFLISNVFGQDNTDINSEKPPVDNQKINALFNEILLETPLLKSKENQILILTHVIDLLWMRDEKKARQLTRETADKLRSELDPEKVTESFYIYSPKMFGDLRQDFITMLVKHDLTLAREMKVYTEPRLLKISPTDQSKSIQLRNWSNDERDLEQRMAFIVGLNDLETSQKIAIESLEKGFSNESLNTLRRFQVKDGKVADSFADYLVEKLLKADFAKDNEAFDTAGIFIKQMDENKGTFGRILQCECPKPLNLDLQKFRKLSSKWLDDVLSKKEEKIASDFLSAMSVLKKHLPERQAVIKNKYDSINKTQPKRVEQNQLWEKLFDDKTSPEEIAALGIEKSEEERFTYYRRALSKAANNSKAALELLYSAVEKHPASEEKIWLLDQVNYYLSGKTADEGNLDKAWELTNKIEKKDSRLSMLAFLARKFYENGEVDKAKQISSEIAVMLDLDHKDKMPKSIVGYSIFSNIFQTLALVDTERAFILLENVMPTSNEYLLKSFQRMDNGENIRLSSLLKRHSFALFGYDKSIKKLAETDFERLKRLSNYLEHPDILVFAKVLILKIVIDGNLDFKDFSNQREKVIIKG